MKTMAQELAPQRIRVNAISPGAIKTPINTAAWDTPEAEAELLKLIPYRRVGEPEDIGPRHGLAGLRRLRLRHRRDAVCGRRHDPVSWFRGGRLR
jgi:NAD(P)-dependent dehydrogenase (short-subunit alcohol dehydrogenase family)